jgi:hypothetical protein
MAVFYFNLRDGRAGVIDIDGTDLPDLVAAKAHAVVVARELIKCKELKKRDWRLDVRDSHGDLLFVVPFATVDPTLDHLKPELRQLIERLCEAKRSLRETAFSTETLRLHIDAARARSMGKPYLAARLGHRVDTPPAGV